MKIYERNKKEGRRGDIIKLISLHFLYHYSYSFSYFQKEASNKIKNLM
jgi:hypothetical protein